MSRDLASRFRDGTPCVGYWVTSDNPVATERIGAAGYDYVCLDLQHGMIDYSGCVRGSDRARGHRRLRCRAGAVG